MASLGEVLGLGDKPVSVAAELSLSERLYARTYTEVCIHKPCTHRCRTPNRCFRRMTSVKSVCVWARVCTNMYPSKKESDKMCNLTLQRSTSTHSDHVVHSPALQMFSPTPQQLTTTRKWILQFHFYSPLLPINLSFDVYLGHNTKHGECCKKMASHLMNWLTCCMEAS